MSWPHSLRVTIPINTTVDWGVCDRCYFLFDLNDLVWQWDQRGRSLANLRIRVCPRCLDDPATTLAPIIIIGPEGVVRDPRPYQYEANAEGGTTPPDLNGFPFASPNDIPDGP